MKKTITYIAAGLLFFTSISYGQKEKKAAKAYDDYAYMSAIATYKSLNEKGLSNSEIYERLGDANYFNANYQEASKWYLKLLELKDDNLDKSYIYKCAQSLKSSGDYTQSDALMERYLTAVEPANVRASKYKEQKDYIAIIKNNSGRYTIENMNVNSNGSDFAPSFYKKSLYFASARDTGIAAKRTHEWNNKGLLDIYGNIDGSIEKLSKEINTKFHESTSVFTKDGNTMYFTRNNFVDGIEGKDTKDVMRLKIYKASMVDGKWSNIEELPFNSDLYSVAHPALSIDEKQLYFVSDMPDSVGESDLYSVAITENAYGTPKNLGKNINTEGRESFPSVSKEGVLYFSSDGHPGLGGLDVFAVRLDELSDGKVLNVGAPVNGTQDDFTYIIDDMTNTGYFASNRAGGKGGDDIYSFTENSPLAFDCDGTISGIAKDKETNEILANVTVILTSSETGKLVETVTDASGNYSFAIDCNDLNYVLSGAKELYEGETHQLKLTRKEAKLYKQELLLAKQDLAEVLNLKPIYFNFDKSDIREDAALELDKVVAYLKKYTTLNVEVRSHTDSRGKDSYNLKLSDERAKATAAYLVAQGILEIRISGNGYGESEIENGCTNGVRCSKKKHELNRRSEFIVSIK